MCFTLKLRSEKLAAIDRISGVAVVLAVFVGAALRIWQYASNTSLSIDEIALADEILHQDLRSLLINPLPHDQIAPTGFLLIERFAVFALGPGDNALRLFPFICALISLLAFAILAVRMFDRVAAIAAVVLFATAAPFILFSSSVKQYSTEICVAVLLSWLSYELMSRSVTPYRAVWAALFGSVLVWFSLSSVLMIAGLSVTLAVWATTLKSTQTRRAILAVVACWGASALAVTVVYLVQMRPDTHDYMQSFWAPGFPPQPLFRILQTGWPLGQLRDLFGQGQNGLAYPLPLLYVIVTAVGFGLLWRQNRKAAGLLIAPIVVTLAAAVVRLYPFSDRLILFLIPSFFIGIAAVIESVTRLLWSRSPSLAVLTAVLLILPAVYPVAATLPPYRTEHIKPVFSFISDRRQPGDAMYVYYGAAPAVIFYGNEYGLDRSEYAVGGCHRGDARQYLNELDSFRGRSRVWIVLTHANPRFREREDILAYLDTIGSRIESIVVEARGVTPLLLPAEAYLYDLNITDKRATDPGAAFPLSGPSSVGPDAGCGVGPQAMVPGDFR